MRITGLNHFNLVTDDIAAAVAFYESLGLVRGVRPDFGNTGEWLYIGKEPKVHINLRSEVYPNDVVDFGDSPGDTVNHLGFDVHGTLEAVCAELTALGIKHRLWPVPVAGWYRALYFNGPCGEEIEFVLKDCLVPAGAAAEAPQAVAAA